MRKRDFSKASDLALVEFTRSGENAAYAELWKRHISALIVAIRSFTGFDADDIAQETFLRIYQQIQDGRGPETAFRAYAIRAARNVATNMARCRASDEITGNDDEVFEYHAFSSPDPAGNVVGNIFTQRVFATLPARWQEVLWYRDVEGLDVREFSGYLGLRDNSASALLRRAREGFKQAWIAANLEQKVDLSQDCQWVVEMLPRWTRGKASATAHKKLGAHFEACTRCARLVKESKHLQSRLALILLPPLLGGGGATGYLAWLQTGAAPAASAAIMDSSLLTAVLPETMQSVSAASKAGGILGAGASKVLLVPLAVATAGMLATTVALSLDAIEPTSVAAAPIVTESETRAPITTSSSQGDRDEDTKVADQRDDAQKSAEALTSEMLASQVGDSVEVSSDFEVTDVQPDKVPNAPASDAAPEPASDIVLEPDPTPEPDSKLGPEPVPVLQAELMAVPVDGEEIGVFPRLTGEGAPNASIELRVKNEHGQSYSRVVKTDPQGHWSFDNWDSKLAGTLTVTGVQSYTQDGVDFTDDAVAIGTYDVGNGLYLKFDRIGPQETRIHVIGLEGPITKNQVVNVQSFLLGEMLVEKGVPTSPGEYVFTVNHSRSEMGTLRVWQGDTSTGLITTQWFLSAH